MNTAPEMSSPKRPPSRGRYDAAFSLVETLVAIGIICLLLAFALPLLSRTRTIARQTTTVARLHELGLVVSSYAQDYRDKPPVVFSPTYSRGVDDMQVVALNNRLVKGAWFNNGDFFHFVFNPALPADALLDPTNPRKTRAHVDGVATVNSADFRIADCLYAAPEYWSRTGQRGPAQWGPQSLTSIQFPSQKGLMKQTMVYDIRDHPTGYPSCCYGGVRSALLWADLSAETLVLAELRQGVPNFWHHGLPGPIPYWASGTPVDDTETGLRGRDR